MPTLPFKLNQDRRHHIPEQKRRVTNWREYDESLRRRGRLTVWFSDEAVAAWEAERRTSRGGQPEYSDLAILTAGGAAAEAARRGGGRRRRRRCRALAPAGGQHGAEALRRGRVA